MPPAQKIKVRLKEIKRNADPGIGKNSEAVLANVMFGSPHRNCEGSGICNVVAPVTQVIDRADRISCKRAVAVVTIELHGSLVFQFVRKSMCRKAIDRYFKGDLFIVESPFDFRRNFWSRDYYRIQPGTYPVTHCKEFITVVFNVEDKNQKS